MERPKKLPQRFWNLLYYMGVNPNNYELVKNNYENFIVRDLKTGKTLLPVRY